MDEQNKAVPEQSQEQGQTQSSPAPTPPETSDAQTQPNQTESTPPAYEGEEGKTNWAKLIAIYALIGLVVYVVIWYFFLRSSGPY